MTWIIAVFMLLLWTLAVTSARTLGGAVHVLLAAALLLMASRLPRLGGRPAR